MQVPLDTPVQVRAEKFRGVLDDERAAAYRVLQESGAILEEAEAPPVRSPRLAEGGRSLVALARGRDRAEAIRLAADLLGGFGRAVDPPGPVLLKPNFNSADPFPASTHPDHLQTVIDLLREAGCAEIAVGEMGGLLSLPAKENFERWGMPAFGEKNGLEVLRFDEEPWVRAHAPGAVRWGGWVHCIERLLRPGQHVVNLPTMKSHGGGPRFSLSLKNVYGFVHPRDRVRAHFVPQMAEMIIETNLLYTPSLIVLDGTKCWISGGPYTGEERAPNLIIAGDDRIAVDVAGAAVLRFMGAELMQGYPVWSHRQIRRAVALGLGACGPEEVALRFADATGSADFPDLEEKVRALVAEGDPGPGGAGNGRPVSAEFVDEGGGMG
ncbi:MAG: DUF362 domain-containing protein [bacterium]